MATSLHSEERLSSSVTVHNTSAFPLSIVVSQISLLAEEDTLFV